MGLISLLLRIYGASKSLSVLLWEVIKNMREQFLGLKYWKWLWALVLLHLESSLGVVRLVLLGHLLWGLVISFTVACLLLGQLWQTVHCVLPVTGSVFPAHCRNIMWLQGHGYSICPLKLLLVTSGVELPPPRCVTCQWWRGFASVLCELFLWLTLSPALNPHLNNLCHELLAWKMKNHHRVILEAQGWQFSH